jgi:hypothetical protein
MITEGYGGTHRKKDKKLANRAVRRAREISSGKAYRKEYNSWNIVDFKWMEPKNKKLSRK